ncbi:hypothetical protein [Nonomuraea rhizosphaerae]|uniref:hypothetical protein n=1 Tax=Nonomuraea rhizosphaerae TaxID=2665663 RepID=UPI001C5E0343|nr:hypothetical protein [Nonomuraea rhizosphaerae]
MELDDIRGLRLRDSLRPPRPAWVNLLVIGFGLCVVATQALGLLSGKPWDGYQVLFGWDSSSWWWLGRVVVITGWFLIIALNVRIFVRKRAGS